MFVPPNMPITYKGRDDKYIENIHKYNVGDIITSGEDQYIKVRSLYSCKWIKISDKKYD